MAGTETNDGFVDLHITGSPVIAMMRKSFDAVAKVGPHTTWYQLLEGYGMKLSPEDGVYVRTAGAGVNMVSSEGHDRTITAELHEPIMEFMNKFKNKRTRHTVRLLYKNGHGFKTRPKKERKMGNDGNRKPTTGPSIVIGTGPTGIATASDHNEIYRKPRYTPLFSRASVIGGQRFRYGTRLRSGIAKNRASTSAVGNHATAVKAGVSKKTGARRRQIPIQQCTMYGPPAPRIEDEVVVKDEPIVELVELDSDDSESVPMEDRRELEGTEIEVEHDNGREDGDLLDEEDDNMGLMEAQGARQEDEEVTPAADLNSSGQHKLEQFDNSFLLDARREIKNLQKNHLWVKIVQRSPLGCYILQEILKC